MPNFISASLLLICAFLLANRDNFCSASGGKLHQTQQNIVAETEVQIKLEPAKGDEKCVEFDDDNTHLTATLKSAMVKSMLVFKFKKTSARLYGTTLFRHMSSRRPDLPKIQYFEIKVEEIGRMDENDDDGFVRIGLKGYQKYYEYPSNGFIRFLMHGEEYAKGDVVGCGLYTPNYVDHFIFFTKMDKVDKKMKLVEIKKKYQREGAEKRISLLNGENGAGYTPEVVIAGEGTKITANFKDVNGEIFKEELDRMVRNGQFKHL